MDKNKFTQAAAKLVQKGQIDKAIAEYRKARKADPKDVRILLKIGELQQKKGDNRDAADTLQEAAKSYANDGFFLKAVAVFKQIVKIDPERTQVNLELADLYQQLGLMSDAMTQLQAVANHHERSGDGKSALEILRRMVDLDPENVSSRIKLGELFAQQGQNQDALRELRVSAEHLKSHGRMDVYLRVAERIATLAPDDLALSRELAALHLGKKDARKALVRLQVNFSADPHDVGTLELLAKAFQELGQLAKTISVYKELARLHREASRRDEEGAAWRKVLELAPDDPDAAAAFVRGPAPFAAPSVAPPAAMPTGGPPLSRTPAPSPGFAQASRAGAARISAGPSSGGRRSGGPPGRPAGAATQADKEKLPKLLTEIDVYLKYGLNEKAASHVALVLSLDPGSIDGHERAVQARTALGDGSGARESMIAVARLCLAKGELDRGRVHLHRLIDTAADHPAVQELIAAYSGGDEANEIDAPEPSILLEIDEAEAPPLARFERPLDDPFDLGQFAPATPPRELHAETVGSRALDGAAMLDVPEGDEELIVPAEEALEELPAQLPDSDEAPAAGPALLFVPETAPEPEPDEAVLAPGADEAPPPSDGADDLLLVGNEGDGEILEDLLDAGANLLPADDTAATAFDEARTIALLAVASAEEAPTVAFPVAATVDEEIVEEPWAEAALEFHGEDEPPVSLGYREPSEIETQLAEGAFFLEQGYAAEAEETFRAVLTKAPGHELATNLLEEAIRRGRGEQAPAAEPLPVTVIARLTPPPKADAGGPAHETGPDSQFDLGADLAEELDSLGSVTGVGGELRHVDDILAEFKRGVSQIVRAEDTDTHYDLGIAYKEMGLLADAVSEFSVARQGCIGKKKEIDCLTMAGMCEALQGKHDRAVEAFRTALGAPAIGPDAAKALHYEIGASLEALGDLVGANEHFRQVAQADPGYRDVAVALTRTDAAPPPVPGRPKEGRGEH